MASERWRQAPAMVGSGASLPRGPRDARSPRARLRWLGFARTGKFWLLALPVVFLALGFVGPLGAVVWTAASEKGVSGGGDVLSQPLFVTAVQRTLVMAVVVTGACWVLSVVYAFGLALAGRRMRAFLFASLLAIFWVSVVIRMYGWILLYQPSGMLSDVLRSLHLIGEPLRIFPSTLAMYPAMVHVMLPFMIFPLYNALMAIEPSHVRAAESLGAGSLTVVRKVLLPQMRSGSVAGIVLVFLISLGFFITPAMLGSASDLTIGTVINLQFNELFDFGSAAVMATVVVVAVLALYVVADGLTSVSSRWGGGEL
jgi:putative spermidine/putrescine transport system permease protein